MGCDGPWGRPGRTPDGPSAYDSAKAQRPSRVVTVTLVVVTVGDPSEGDGLRLGAGRHTERS